MFRSPLAVVVGAVVVTQLAIFVTTIWLHRALSHRAMTVTPGLTRLFRVVTWITTGFAPASGWPCTASTMPSPTWRATPTRRSSRVPQGPALQRRALPPGGTQPGRGGPLRARPPRGSLGSGRCSITRCSASAIGIAVLCVLFGPWLALVASLVHVVLYLSLNAAVNAVGHTFGERPHANLAANSQWLAWLAAGEGLHNNHHAAPTSARLSMGRAQVDPAWPVIRFLERHGWAPVRHAEPKLKQAAAA